MKGIRKALIGAATLALRLSATAQQSWLPSKFGPADELGAAKLVKTYSLGITVNTTYNDDLLNCWTGIGTQLDGLGHIGVGDRYYNGNKWDEFATMGGLKKLGADKVPPFVTRGVLLDMAACYGVAVGRACRQPGAAQSRSGAPSGK